MCVALLSWFPPFHIYTLEVQKPALHFQVNREYLNERSEKYCKRRIILLTEENRTMPKFVRQRGRRNGSRVMNHQYARREMYKPKERDPAKIRISHETQLESNRTAIADNTSHSAATESSMPQKVITEDDIVQFIKEMRRRSDEERRIEKPARENVNGCF
ncbi:hypothetical protein TNIN_202991 [Trichonephila inaurata madagascariensis]|uniref:Uncharacterized protein n=1 Tax=Trichonephila inaurata madagascariensis TaxID=2747483 RepID=A0A8X6X530_9ARAC|nr:hypothetical protein TNIN_202991 [Trichonephila inaurata madagascariensis]